jgi:phage FluMu protein Com
LNERRNLETTKYVDNKFRTYANVDPNAYIPIIVSNESFSNHYHKTFTCELCNTILTRLHDSGDNTISFYCPKCNSNSYDTESLKTKSKFKTKEGPIEHPAASVVPDVGLIRKRVEYKGAFKTLSQRPGLKITSYSEIRPEKEK